MELHAVVPKSAAPRGTWDSNWYVYIETMSFNLQGRVILQKCAGESSASLTGLGTYFSPAMIGRWVSFNDEDILRISSYISDTQMKVVGFVREDDYSYEYVKSFDDVFIEDIAPESGLRETTKSLLETSLTKEQIIRVLDVI